MITACANAGLLSPCICRFGSIELADKFEEAFTLAKQGKLTTPVTSEGTSAPAKEKAPEKKAEAPVKKAETPVKKPESPAKGPEKETTPGKSVFGSGSIFIREADAFFRGLACHCRSRPLHHTQSQVREVLAEVTLVLLHILL